MQVNVLFVNKSPTLIVFGRTVYVLFTYVFVKTLHSVMERNNTGIIFNLHYVFIVVAITEE